VENNWPAYLQDLNQGQFHGILIALGDHFQMFQPCSAIRRALEMKQAGQRFYLYRDWRHSSNVADDKWVEAYLNGQTCQ
jgi:hypothetical protein